jgi:DNA-binding transcriptional ArsR family regulator
MKKMQAKGRNQLSRDERDNRVFKAMANPDRRRIMDLLRNSRHNTGEICAHFPTLNRCTVMQHLGVLSRAGLIISKKEGRCRWHYLDVSPVQRIHERWIKDYAVPASDFLLKLKQDLEQ